MPAYFGHWIGATNRDVFDKEITSLKQLGQAFRETLLWRLGEDIARGQGLDQRVMDWQQTDNLFYGLAEQALRQHPKALMDRYNSLDFMHYALDDYQIALSHSIPAKRILKILPQGNEFGRVLRKQKQAKYGQ